MTTCCICGWAAEIGGEAHAEIIHPTIRTAVIQQMDEWFIVSLAANPAPAGRPSTKKHDIGTDPHCEWCARFARLASAAKKTP